MQIGLVVIRCTTFCSSMSKLDQMIFLVLHLYLFFYLGVGSLLRQPGLMERRQIEKHSRTMMDGSGNLICVTSDRTPLISLHLKVTQNNLL